MAPPVAYFDLLEDGVVQEVVLRIKEPARDSWQSLSATCRRMCTLVRATRAVKVQCDKAIDGLQQLLHLPSSRAFRDVRVLSVTNYEDRSMAEWTCFSDALAAAAATWPSMEEVLLDAKLMEKRQYNNHECKPGCLSSPLMALRHAPALRRLSVKLYDDHSFAYLPVVTQVTHLELACEETNPNAVTSSQRLSLAAMSNLVSLQLGNTTIKLCATCELPPNLTFLGAQLGRLNDAYAERDWGVHLAGCKQLRELQLMVPWCEMDVYPTALIQDFAEQLTGLVKLGIDIDDSSDMDHDDMVFFEEFLYSCPQEWAPLVTEADALSQLPLVTFADEYNPACYVLIPPPRLSQIHTLQQLHVSGWWLAAPSARYWRVLAGCSSLRSLLGLHASVPPPAGVTFPGVTRLEVTTSTSPGDTVVLLGAFPALREVELTVVPPDSGADVPPAAQPVVVQALSTAHITFEWPFEKATAAAQAPSVAAYCTPLWAALPGLQRLVVQWPCPVPRSYAAEVRADKRRAAAIALGALQERDPGYRQSLLPVHVGVEQLLPALQGATQLQSLDLVMELDPSSRDQAVLGVQEALPGLTRLATLDGAAGLAPATVGALRPGLLHALIAG